MSWATSQIWYPYLEKGTTGSTEMYLLCNSSLAHRQSNGDGGEYYGKSRSGDGSDEYVDAGGSGVM